MLTKNSKGQIIDSSGLVFEVLDQISYKLNFSYSIREPADGKWGVTEVEMNMLTKKGKHLIIAHR